MLHGDAMFANHVQTHLSGGVMMLTDLIPVLLCSLPAQERTISLESIGQRTKLEVDGVEFLLMKTLSLHLIEGIVDQVDGNVKVSCATCPTW